MMNSAEHVRRTKGMLGSKAVPIGVEMAVVKGVGEENKSGYQNSGGVMTNHISGGAQKTMDQMCST